MAKQLHVKDGNAKPDPAGSKALGEGNTDFFKQMELLKNLGYEGWIISETFYERPRFNADGEDYVSSARKDVEKLRAAFADYNK